MYYTDNDFRLYHSAKGSTWKDHLYSAKKNIGGKIRYIYNTADPLGIKKRKELEEETETLRKYNRNAAYEKDLADHAYSTHKELANDYKKSGYGGDLEASKFAGRQSGEWYNNIYADGGYYTPGTRQRSEQGNLVNKLRNEYARTPLGRVEKFVEPGRKAISSALKYIDDTVDNLTKRR